MYASQPAIVELTIGQPIHHPPPKYALYAVLEIIGFILSGLIAAYLLPDSVIAKVMVFGSALFSAVLIYIFNVAGML